MSEQAWIAEAAVMDEIVCRYRDEMCRAGRSTAEPALTPGQRRRRYRS